MPRNVYKLPITEYKGCVARYYYENEQRDAVGPMEHKALATLRLLNLVRDETRIKQGEAGPWTAYGNYPFSATEVAEANQLTFERGTEYKGQPDETWIAQAARLLKAFAVVVMLLILIIVIINSTIDYPKPFQGAIVEELNRRDESAAPAKPGQSP